MSLLLDLEENRTRRRTAAECLAETSPDLVAQMQAVLQRPDLVLWILAAIARAGVAGEQRLALTVYLTGTSRLLAEPLALIVQGPSSSGKSFVLDRVAKLFPLEAVLLATDVTPQSLYYMAEGELKHRFIVAGERTRRQNDEAAQGTKALRELLSAQYLSKLVTINDGSGPRTVEIRQEGPIAYAESTTATELFEEDANRCLIVQPDERPEQTRRILAARARQLAGGARESRDQWQEPLHALHRLLEPVEVVIPYAERVFDALPEQRLEVRRAAGQVSSMIQAFALLHQ